MSRMPTPTPTSPSTHLYRAAQMLDKGQAAQARVLIQQTLRKEPNNAWANQLMRHALTRVGEMDAALYYAEKVHKAAPDAPDTANLLAASLINVHRNDDAEAVLVASLDKHPAHGLNHALLGSMLGQSGKLVRCLEHCEKAFELNAGNNTVVTTCANALLKLGMPDNACALLQQACQAGQANPYLLSMLCGTMQYSPNVKPADLVAAHFAFGRMLTAQMPKHMVPAPGENDPERRLRVGFIGADFRDHAMIYFAEPLIEYVDRSRTDVYLYMHSDMDDEHTTRLRSYPGTRYANTFALGPAALADRIRQDGIDVLIDCASHTSTSILLAMHMRPAPVQASWLAYPFTSGVASIDWRIVDADTDPEGSEKLGSERLWRLGSIAQAYRPPADLPPVAPCPSSLTPDNNVTFGSFGSSMKLNDHVVRLWCRVLREIPGSKLVVKNATLKHEAERAHLARRFEVSGINPSRVEMLAYSKTNAEHMALYSKMDIALDTFPYPSITTACEALTMGVPLVTMTGETSLRRSSVPVMKSVGLDDLIASDEDAYIEVAKGLARDPVRREKLRASLRQTLLGSALGDQRGFADRFGAAIRGMWKDHVVNAKSRLSN